MTTIHAHRKAMRAKAATATLLAAILLTSIIATFPAGAHPHPEDEIVRVETHVVQGYMACSNAPWGTSFDCKSFVNGDFNVHSIPIEPGLAEIKVSLGTHRDALLQHPVLRIGYGDHAGDFPATTSIQAGQTAIEPIEAGRPLADYDGEQSIKVDLADTTTPQVTVDYAYTLTYELGYRSGEADPAPEPGPGARVETWDFPGYISCSVAYQSVATKDHCGELLGDPNAQARFQFDLDDGLTGLAVYLSADADLFGQHHPMRIKFLSPPALGAPEYQVHGEAPLFASFDLSDADWREWQLPTSSEVEVRVVSPDSPRIVYGQSLRICLGAFYDDQPLDMGFAAPCQHET